MLVALVGVHGVGKTTTAKAMEKRGWAYIPIAVPSDAQLFQPMSRQIFFFSQYVLAFLRAVQAQRKHDYIVIDSHPLLVLPYTLYWVGDDGLIDAMSVVIERLPKVDLLAYLYPERIETVLERVIARGRNLGEEVDEGYISFVNEYLRLFIDKMGSNIARKTVFIPAELEVKQRVKLVEEAAFYGKGLVSDRRQKARIQYQRRGSVTHSH